MIDDLRVNGNLIGWGSHILKMDGERIYGITSIGFDQKRERSYGYGMTRAHAPSGRTGGKYTPGAVKMTLRKSIGCCSTSKAPKTTRSNSTNWLS